MTETLSDGRRPPELRDRPLTDAFNVVTPCIDCGAAAVGLDGRDGSPVCHDCARLPLDG